MNKPLITAKIKNDHHEDYTYVFEPQALNAIKAAVLINRPLLVKGKPGSGKSQLAKAAASYLDRAFISHVVSAKTEAQNLLWSFDAVARLADAQIEGALCKAGDNAEEERQSIREKLALKNYIKPEALWAALNWANAEEQFKVLAERQGQKTDSYTYKSPMSNYHNYKKALSNGVVVLIDEIDKADSSLPNGLLEVLGSNRFQPDGLDKPIELNSSTAPKGNAKVDNTKTKDPVPDSPKPLIIITTNDEHPLPDAFVRRCLVVEVGMPEGEQKQKEFLVTHAQPNYEKLHQRMISDENGDEKNVLEVVADQLIQDRKEAEKNNVKPLVGQAEYFDLLRGINTLVKQSADADIEQWIKSLACFSSQKGQGKASAGSDLPVMGDESNVV